VIAALIVVGLAVGVVLLWPRSTADDPPGAEASTTITTALTTTTALGTTTSTIDDSHVVETVEEAEEILRELWFGWFEGIYNQDEERIREVVATEQMLNAATAAFGADFARAPSPDGIELDVEILHSNDQCLATWSTLDVTEFRGPEATTEAVHVFRFVEGTWRFATSWTQKEDLWEADCEVELLPLP